MAKSAIATKACAHCGTAKPLEAFAADRSRADGLTRWCRECRNARQRNGYQPTLGILPSGPAPAAARDGDKRQARRRVNHLVATGKMADPNALSCLDCGHLGPDRRHEYDHHRGYDAAHHLEVEAVCSSCHHVRESRRRRAA